MPEEYNLFGSLPGLGKGLLIEVIHEMVDKRDVVNVVGLNGSTYSLKDDPWFPWASLPSRALHSSLFSHIHRRRIDCIEYYCSIHKDLDRIKSSMSSQDCGKTPLLVAIEEGDEEITELLLNGGADPNTQNTSLNINPLHLAIKQNNMTIVRLLLKHNADVTITDYEMRSPLTKALIEGYKEIAIELIEHGADLNDSVHGISVLLYAVEKNYLSVVDCLLNHGADVNEADNYGYTPLYIAAEIGHLSIVQCLINHGADVNKAENNGWSPLYTASEKGHLSIVEYLVNHGADVNKADNYGCTPLHIAAKQGH